MIPQEHTDPAQLPLPFQPSLVAQMAEEDRAAALTALAQLLLSAAGISPEEAADEH